VGHTEVRARSVACVKSRPGGHRPAPEDRSRTPAAAGGSPGSPAATALYELRRTGGRYALVTMCIGGGQGIAAILERV
jgi:acetyl-CoA C-acetyltransferase